MLPVVKSSAIAVLDASCQPYFISCTFESLSPENNVLIICWYPCPAYLQALPLFLRKIQMKLSAKLPQGNRWNGDIRIYAIRKRPQRIMIEKLWLCMGQARKIRFVVRKGELQAQKNHLSVVSRHCLLLWLFCFSHGSRSGTWTHTARTPRDFKSLVSTDSTIRPGKKVEARSGVEPD